MASKGMRTVARLLDGTFELVLIAFMLWFLGDSLKIWTDIFLAVATITAYEAISTCWWGGSPGKLIAGIRVVELDRERGPAPGVSAGAAVRRGLTCATLTMLPIIGWALWALSALGDAIGRGVDDRVARTMAVPATFKGTVKSVDLPGYADAARTPRLVAAGRIADLDVRARARLRRLTGEPVLAAAIGLLALTISLPFATMPAILASSVAWIVVFIFNETRLVHRTGATAGHDMAGLVIAHRRTGGPPPLWPSLRRAIVLALTLYVPLLWPLLGVSALLMRFSDTGRGLHDLAGGTFVISDPRLTPEEQRQRSMKMRLGLAG